MRLETVLVVVLLASAPYVNGKRVASYVRTGSVLSVILRARFYMWLVEGCWSTTSV